MSWFQNPHNLKKILKTAQSPHFQAQAQEIIAAAKRNDAKPPYNIFILKNLLVIAAILGVVNLFAALTYCNIDKTNQNESTKNLKYWQCVKIVFKQFPQKLFQKLQKKIKSLLKKKSEQL